MGGSLKAERSRVPFSDLLVEPLRNGIYKTSEFHGHGTKVINMGELFSHSRIKRSLPMQRLELYSSEKQRFLVQEGDLIFARRSLTAAGAGKCSIVISLDEETTFESSIIRARLNKDISNPEFYYYFFGSELGKQLLSTILRQVAVSGITGKDLAALSVPFVEKHTQDRVVTIVRRLDERIELLGETNQTLEQIAQALFQSWFVDFDPVRAKVAALTEGRDPVKMAMAAISGKTEAELAGLTSEDYERLARTAALFPDSLVESELGEIPRGWEVGSVLEQAQLISGGTPKTDEPTYWDGLIPWASAKDVSQAGQTFLIETERKISEAGLNESATKMVPEFTTVVVARGATTGRLVMLGNSMAMNQTCYGLCSKKATPFYLYCHARTFIAGMVGAAHGSVFDTITTSTFQATTVLLAPTELAADFEGRVTPLFQRIRDGLLQNQSLSDLRDTLLPKLLSGELAIPAALDGD